LDVGSATKHAMRSLAHRYLELDQEITELVEHLDRLTFQRAPQLRAAFGVGPDTSAALIIAVGDNPSRVTSERAFAAMCGTNPIPASSGNTTRHRLNRVHRGGVSRQAFYDWVTREAVGSTPPSWPKLAWLRRCARSTTSSTTPTGRRR
jgi:transposase